mmetsp:Transcript_4126/g.6894  ORF Transcript_4126/g.6894 Transcript_4126/m.6894 type:complete len:181 (+) Transcript_4126:2-544(+)
MDASFASSLDDSLRRLSNIELVDRHKKCDAANTNNDSNNSKELPKKERTITRRKSIPRHRNLELNSSISSCLRPAKYTTTTNGSDRSLHTTNNNNNNNSDRSLRTTWHNKTHSSDQSIRTSQTSIRTYSSSETTTTTTTTGFNSSMEDFIDDDDTDTCLNHNWVASGVVIDESLEVVHIG